MLIHGFLYTLKTPGSVTQFADRFTRTQVMCNTIEKWIWKSTNIPQLVTKGTSL
jgi:hypothetical protein